MTKITKYPSGAIIVSHNLGLELNNEEPSEEIELGIIPDGDFEKLVANPKDKKLIAKLTQEAEKTKI